MIEILFISIFVISLIALIVFSEKCTNDFDCECSNCNRNRTHITRPFERLAALSEEAKKEIENNKP